MTAPSARMSGRGYAGGMNWGTVWTVLGAIVSIVIAWFIVNALLSLMWFAFKLVGVLIVGAIVFFLLRRAFAGRERDVR